MYTIIPLLLAHIQELNNQIIFEDSAIEYEDESHMQQRLVEYVTNNITKGE